MVTKRGHQWQKLANAFMQAVFQSGLHQHPHFLPLIQRGNALIAWEELDKAEIVEPLPETHDQAVS
jgi:hypothetical protein